MIFSLLKQGEYSAAGYLLGWKIVGKLPRKLVDELARIGADYVSDSGRGMEQLRCNLSRVVGPENVTAQLVRDSVRSYARYWVEAFRLPQLTQDRDLMEKITEGIEGIDHLDRSVSSGRGVILTLPHTGNWDMAGMWLVNSFGTLTTVAERLKPEVLFREFVKFRHSLGFDVLALSGGDTPPFDYLKDVLHHGGVVCLLGERDLKASGVEVEFFGEKTTMPVGPALLAQETGAALHVVHCWFTPDGWGNSVSPPIEVTELDETVQRVANEFAANIRQHPTDWHMLQPLWPKDRKERRRRKQQQDS